MPTRGKRSLKKGGWGGHLEKTATDVSRVEGLLHGRGASGQSVFRVQPKKPWGEKKNGGSRKLPPGRDMKENHQAGKKNEKGKNRKGNVKRGGLKLHGQRRKTQKRALPTWERMGKMKKDRNTVEPGRITKPSKKVKIQRGDRKRKKLSRISSKTKQPPQILVEGNGGTNKSYLRQVQSRKSDWRGLPARKTREGSNQNRPRVAQTENDRKERSPAIRGPKRGELGRKQCGLPGKQKVLGGRGTTCLGEKGTQK